MKTGYIFGTTVFAGLIFIAASCQVLAGEPLALRKIMSELGKNMQTITDGISREDWELVEKAAAQIADHPKPPIVERVRILSFAGSDISKFKGHDNKTHEAATVLANVAAEKDGYTVISAFSTLQNTCLACHQSFRKSFQEHFYQN